MMSPGYLAKVRSARNEEFLDKDYRKEEDN
jgi:hypothetical protein